MGGMGTARQGSKRNLENRQQVPQLLSQCLEPLVAASQHTHMGWDRPSFLSSSALYNTRALSGLESTWCLRLSSVDAVMFLAFPRPWGLHCDLDFTLTALCFVLSGSLRRTSAWDTLCLEFVHLKLCDRIWAPQEILCWMKNSEIADVLVHNGRF